MNDRKHYERRMSALQQERQSWESHWRDLSDYILPRRGRFMGFGNKQNGQPNRGDKINSKIIDSTATFALNTLSSGMMSGITSPARPWFRLVTGDPAMMEFGPVKEWLSSVETTLRRVFATSNIYNCLQSTYEELGLFGTAALFVEEDYNDIVRGYPFTCGEYFVANSPRLAVDSIYRSFQLTVSQVVGRFGIEKCSQHVKAAYDRGDYDQWVTVCHAVEPNPHKLGVVPEFAGRRGSASPYIPADRKAFISCYWEQNSTDKGSFLSIGGYDEFPVMAPRWHLTGSDSWGRSPAMDALGDVKQLQHMEKTAAHAIDLMVKPPMQAPSALKNQPATILPGGITYVDAMSQGQGLRPTFEVNPRLNEFAMKEGEVRDRINRAFYADLFLMMAQSDRRQVTAREIDERHEEKMLALGPVLERLQNELLGPLIDRTFNILVRNSQAGWQGLTDKMVLPPPPPEMKGMDLKVDYISILAQAQKAVGTVGLERVAGFVGNLAAANPEVLDKFDMDQAVDEYGEMLGVSPRVIRSDVKVEALRQGRAKQQQAMQQAQAGMTAVQGAKVLSDVDTGQKNALTDILGMRVA